MTLYLECKKCTKTWLANESDGCGICCCRDTLAEKCPFCGSKEIRTKAIISYARNKYIWID